MLYLIGVILLIGFNIFVCIKCFPNDAISYSVLFSLGSLVLYGFGSVAIMFTIANPPIFFGLFPMLIGLALPLITYATQYRPNQSQTGEHNDEEELKPTLIEKTGIRGPKDAKDFWENPKYSYSRSKILLLIFAIIITIFYHLINWIIGLF